jgi:hypothetical protein
MAIDHQREQLAQREREVEIALLRAVRRCRQQDLAQVLGLLAQHRDVGDRSSVVVRRPPVVEADLAEAAGRALPPEERVVRRATARRHGDLRRRV